MNPPPQRSTSALTAYNVAGLSLAASPRPVSAEHPTESSEQQDTAGSAVVPLPVLETAGLPRFRYETSLMANPGAGSNARLRARPRLTVARWPGDIEVAAQIIKALVDNAAQHGLPSHDGTVSLRLTVGPEADDLVIEVDDAFRHFPRFEVFADSPDPDSRRTSLHWVLSQGVRLSWDQRLDDEGVAIGKTVMAIVPSPSTEEKA
ncbi:ATP-binding protein [Streptomyces sp. NPDC002952]|uniref:ATP-binding protein n=1 Tax=Streptomyces sp. NPDC002952 TaxID=3364673 RepID=UPI0036CBC9C5